MQFECPARTGVPVDGKRCTVHTNRGAHECYGIVDSERIRTEPHYLHRCRCGYGWMCASETNAAWSMFHARRWTTPEQNVDVCNNCAMGYSCREHDPRPLGEAQ